MSHWAGELLIALLILVLSATLILMGLMFTMKWADGMLFGWN